MGKIDHGRNAAVLLEARAAIELEIERLISVLDGLDGDWDLEPIDEREPDPDFEPDCDDEPSLGRLETISQRPGTYFSWWVLDGEMRESPIDGVEHNAMPERR